MTDRGPVDRLEVERDHLLSSLDDLEAEHSAGDIDDDAYLKLRDRYTSRAARLLRQGEPAALAGDDADEPDGTTRGARSQRVAWAVGVIAVATISGVILAQSVGTRGAGTGLTGSGGSDRDRRAECMSMSFSAPQDAIGCYREILERAPDDPEALTYQGWAMVRAGQTDRGWENFERVLALNPDYPDVRVFRASVLAERKQWADAQQELDELYKLNPAAGILSTLSSMGLDREIAFNLLSPAVQPCWKKAEEAARGLSEAAPGSEAPPESRQLLIDAITCLGDVLAADPTNLDALQAQGYLLGVAGNDVLYERARTALDRAVALDADDPTSRLLRAALLNTAGDPAAAKADLDALEGLGRPSPLYSVAPVADIRADIERSLSTTTTTSRP